MRFVFQSDHCLTTNCILFCNRIELVHLLMCMNAHQSSVQQNYIKIAHSIINIFRNEKAMELLFTIYNHFTCTLVF